MAIDWTVTFDARDPKGLADFWALALAYVDEEGYNYEDGLLSTATGCSHRRVLPSRSTGAGELIQFTGRRTRCTADAATVAG